ncbi:hypothetical protein LZ32DRAFT_4513 [Colletotrichum eremochloae]|nr:hypothetical protein LZ32DRAFT_4513 [Colletotrichum eremochloae]
MVPLPAVHSLYSSSRYDPCAPTGRRRGILEMAKDLVPDFLTCLQWSAHLTLQSISCPEPRIRDLREDANVCAAEAEDMPVLTRSSDPILQRRRPALFTGR